MGAVLGVADVGEAAGGVAGTVEAVAGGAVDFVGSLALGERFAGGVGGGDHLVDPGDFVDVGVVDAVGVDGGAAPFHASVEAGHDDALLQAGGGVGSLGTGFADP